MTVLNYTFSELTTAGIGNNGSLRFNASNISNVTQLYINKKDNFGTSYSSLISTFGDKLNVAVTATSADDNSLTCSSTESLNVGSPIGFSGTTFGGVSGSTVYYVKDILSSTKFTITESSSAYSGTTKVLSNASGSMTTYSWPGDDYGKIYLSDGSNIIQFNLAGKAVDSSTYFTIPVTYVSGNLPITGALLQMKYANTTYMIALEDYNSLAIRIGAIMGKGSGSTGYGQTTKSSTLPQNSSVTNQQWNNLRTDMVKARQHQIGITIGSGTGDTGEDLMVPSSGSDVTDEMLGQYKSFLDYVETDKLTVAGSELKAELLAVATQTLAWNDVLSHIVTITGNTSGDGPGANLRYFFNAGGKLLIEVSKSGGTDVELLPKNAAWNSMFNAVGVISIGYTDTTYATFPNANVTTYGLGWEDLNTSDKKLLQVVDPTENYPGNKFEIFGKKSIDGTQIILTINLVDGYVMPVGGVPDDNVTGTLTSRVLQNRPVSTNVTVASLTSSQILTAGAAVLPTYSLSIYKPVTVTNSNSADNTFTCSSTSNFVLGGPIEFSGTVFGGVLTSTYYYVKEIVSSTKFKISDTAGGAVKNLTTSSGSMSGKMYGITTMEEGSTIGVDVNTTNIANGVTLYWTATGTINNQDFQSNQGFGSAQVNNNRCTFNITTASDAFSEGDENFRVQIRTVSTAGTVVATSYPIVITDTSRTPATFSIKAVSSVGGPVITSAEEGETVLFEVTTTEILPGTLLYYKVIPITGNVSGSDFTDNSLTGTVSIDSSGNGIFSKTLSKDLATEGTEIFRVNLYQENPETNQAAEVKALTTNITIDDTSINPATFVIGVDKTSVNEGGNVTFTVNSTNFGSGTLYWSILGTLGVDDFSDKQTSGTVTIINDTGTIFRSILADILTEGEESFTLQLRRNAPGGPVVATSPEVTVVDTSKNLPNYISITPNITTVTEGGTVTFDIITSNITDGEILYWKIVPKNSGVKTPVAEDFVDNTLTGTTVVTGNRASIVRKLKEDLTTEGTEEFIVKVYYSQNMTPEYLVLTSTTVYILDTSVNDQTYQITPSATTFNENNAEITFTVSTQYATATTLYWRIKSTTGKVDASDFVGNSLTGSFPLVITDPLLYIGSGTFSVTLRPDNATEGTEKFVVELLRSLTDLTPIATSIEISINDTSMSTPVYKITPSSTLANEGDTVTFNIDVTNLTTDIPLYWSVRSSAGTVDSSDFTTSIAGTVNLVNRKATFNLTIFGDFITEGVEKFFVDVRETKDSPILVSSSEITITDSTSTLISNPTSVNEGSEITFDITTAGAANGTVFYWTIGGMADLSDFGSQVNSGSVTINDNKGSVTLRLTSDQKTEGTETFFLQLRRDSISGPIIRTSSVVSILDTSTSPEVVVVSLNKGAGADNTISVNEGETITATVTTTNVVNGRVYYWDIVGTTASNDFTSGVVSGSVTIQNGTASFSIALESDLITESNENFFINLRTSVDGGILYTSPKINVIDASAITITANKSVVIEGETVRFVIKTTNFAVTPTLYWTTVGTTVEGDFTDNSLQGTISFGNSNTFNLDRTLVIEGSYGESTENFAIQVRSGGYTGPVLATSDFVTVNDVAYIVTPSSLSIREGDSIDFNITTTNIADNTKLNWEIAGTVVGGDFTITALTGEVTIVGNKGKVSKLTAVNNLVEGDKSFKLVLKDKNSVTLAESASVTLRDVSFTVIPSVTTLSEGGTLTVNINTTNVLNGSTFYWDVKSESSGLVDYDFTTPTSGSFEIQNNSASLSLTVREELLTEGGEYFRVRIKSSESESSVITQTDLILIVDSFTCQISHNAAGNVVNEGDTITFTVTTTGLPATPATKLYWNIVGTAGSVVAGDFSAITGNVDISSNTGTFTVSVVADALTEVTTEKFKVTLKRNASDSELIAQTSEITIADTSKGASSYTVSASPNSVTEGQVVIFNIVTTNVDNGTVFNWDIEPYSTTGGDINDFFGGISGNVVVNNNSGSVSRTLNNELQLEGSEQVNFRLKNLANSVLANAIITILDTSSIVVAPTTPMSVTEGGEFNCVVTASNVANTQLYWTVIGGVDQNDFRNGENSGVFWANAGMGTFTVKLANDILTEGDESFRVQIRTGSTSGAVFANSAVITIKDVSATISPSTLTVKEGSSITFDIATTNINNNANLVWEVRGYNGSAITSGDFTDGLLTGNVTISTNKGSITRNIATDNLSSEGTEQFVLDVKTQDGFVLATSEPINITDVSYNITPNVTSVKEGDTVNFVISTSGVADGTTLYWNTFPTNGIVTADDFNDKKVDGTFNITSNSYTLSRAITRDLSTTNAEGNEKFRIRVFTAQNGIMLAQSEEITIVDVAYALTFDSSTSGSAVIKEGDSITYNVVLAGVDNGTTLHWKLRATTGTLTAADFVSTSGSFTVEGNDKITVNSQTDKTSSPVEGNEIYVVDLFTDAGFTNKVASSPAFTVNDVSIVVTASTTSVSENSSTPITLNLTFSNISNTDVYWAVRSVTGTVNASDFVGANTGIITVGTNTTASISLQVNVDAVTEGLEQFVVDFRLNNPSTGPVIATSPVISITDLAVSIIADKELVGEGDSVVFTVNSSSNPTSSYFWQVRSTGGSVTAADFSTAMSGNITLSAGTGKITLTTVVDTVFNESADKFVVDLFNTSGGTLLVSSQEITIGDVTVSTVLSANEVLEGDEVTITVTTTNLPSPSTLYWEATGSGITAGDFTDNKISGAITVTNNSGTLARKLALDNSNSESSEVFNIKFYLGSASGPLLHTTGNITVLNRWLTITPTSTSVTEGGTLTFNLASQNIPNGTQVSWSIRSLAGTVDSADFTTTPSGNVTLNNNAASFTLTLANDYAKESSEIFVVDATTTISGTVINASSGAITITDVNYTITADKTTIKEGETVQFTVTTEPNVSSVYWKVRSVSGTVDLTDFIGNLDGTLSLTNGVGTVSFKASNNSTEETDESFVIDLYSSNPAQGGVLLPLNQPCPVVTIKDVYCVIKIGNTVAEEYVVYEGDTISINFATTNVADGTKLYWGITPLSGLTSADFEDGILTGEVTISSNSGTITKKLKISDSMSESDEGFVVYAKIGSSSGTIIGVSNGVQVKNRGLTVAPNITSVNEGGEVEFTITTSNITDGTAFAWEVNGLSSSATADFSTAMSGTGTIQNNSALVKVTTLSDNNYEGNEKFALKVTLTALGLTANSAEVTIVDKSISISMSSSAINEAQSVTGTVKYGYGGNLYWKMSSATMTSDDFSGAVEGNVSIDATSKTGTFTITTKNDALAETNNSFVIQILDSQNGNVLATSSPVIVSDVIVTPLSSNPETVNEGEFFTVQFQASNNIPAGTTLYWEIVNTFGNNLINVNDFIAFDSLKGSEKVSEAGIFAMSGRIKFENVTEGNEKFRVEVRISSASGPVIGSSAEITVSDRSATLMPNEATAVNEGDTVTFQLTTTNCNNLLYSWRLVKTGTTSATLNLADHVTTALTGGGTISGSSSTINIPATFKADSLVEGDMQVQLQVTISTAQLVEMISLASSVITVKDTSQPSSFSTTVKEGGKATITVYNAYATTWNWVTEGANGNLDLTPTQGSVNFTNGQASVEINASYDALVEGTETFTVKFNDPSTGSLMQTVGPISILDVSCAITPVASTVYEGMAVGFDIQTQNVDTNTDLYWYYTGTAPSDFINTASGTFKVDSAGKYRLTNLIPQDLANETDKTLILNVKMKDANGALLASSSPVTVKDRNIIVTNYAATAKEGETVTYNIATTNIEDGTLLNWRLSQSTPTITASDFTPAVLTGTTTVNSNAASVSVTLAYDTSIEGTENFKFDVSATYGIVLTYNAPTVTTAISDVTLVVTNPTTVKEGESIEFKLNTLNINSGTTLYYTVRPTLGTITPSMLGISSLNGTVTVNNSAGTLTFALPNDWVVQTDRKFVVDFKITSNSGTVLATSSEVSILDVMATIKTDKDAYNEGDSIELTITTTNVTDGTKFYWKILPDGAYSAPVVGDFSPSAISGVASITSNSFKQNITVVNDLVGDNTYGTRIESFKVQLYTDSAMLNPISSAFTATKTIADTSYTTITASTTSVNEGGTVTFNVSCPNYTGTLYWTTSGTTVKDDFSDLVASGSITITNGSGTLTRNIVADKASEGAETFTIQIRKDSVNGPIVAESALITIQDTSVTIEVGSSSATSGVVYSLTTKPIRLSIKMVGGGGGGGGSEDNIIGGKGGGGGAWSASINLPETSGMK